MAFEVLLVASGCSRRDVRISGILNRDAIYFYPRCTVLECRVKYFLHARYQEITFRSMTFDHGVHEQTGSTVCAGIDHEIS